MSAKENEKQKNSKYSDSLSLLVCVQNVIHTFLFHFYDSVLLNTFVIIIIIVRIVLMMSFFY